MPGVNIPEWVIELKFVWNNVAHPFWSRHYFIGNVTSGLDVYTIGTSFIGKITDFDNWYPRLMMCMATRVAVQSFSYQIIRPQRYNNIDVTTFFFGESGKVVGGSQAWHATCRVNWYSPSPSKRPHWFQLSPVPTDFILTGLPRSEYMERVKRWADFVITPFSTVDGDVWRGALRDETGTFWPITNYSLGLFEGRQKTRRRIN